MNRVLFLLAIIFVGLIGFSSGKISLGSKAKKRPSTMQDAQWWSPARPGVGADRQRSDRQRSLMEDEYLSEAVKVLGRISLEPSGEIVGSQQLRISDGRRTGLVRTKPHSQRVRNKLPKKNRFARLDKTAIEKIKKMLKTNPDYFKSIPMRERK